MQILSFFHLFIRHSGIRTCIRQELLRKNKKINNTRNSNKNTDFPQLEHRKTFISGFKNHTMHNQIGRSTDQCTDTSQNSNIRKRNQKFSSRKMNSLCPPFNNRSKNNNDRSIVQKSRNKSDRRQHSKLCLKNSRFTLRKQFFDNLPQCSRLANTFTYQEKHGNSNHPFITKPFKHLFRTKNAGTKKKYHNRKEYHARTHLVHNKSNHHSQ